MWNVLNLCMSQIWRTVYKYCGLKCFSVSCAQHCPPTLTLHSFQCLLWKHVGCFQLHMNHNSNISFFFFLFFCLFGETMFICNRRNPFRDVRTWGHLQNIAPRAALRLVSHMPFLTSYTVFTVPGAGEKTPLKIITQKWTNWIFSHVDF